MKAAHKLFGFLSSFAIIFILLVTAFDVVVDKPYYDALVLRESLETVLKDGLRLALPVQVRVDIGKFCVNLTILYIAQVKTFLEERLRAVIVLGHPCGKSCIVDSHGVH